MSDLDFSGLSPQDLIRTLNGPALQPPEGVVPNFDHPQNENEAALAGLLVCILLATIFLFLRLYVVLVKTKQSRLGDYFMLLAYAFYLVVCSGSLVRLAQVGLFIHQWDMRGRDVKKYLQTILIGVEFWLAGILLVKTSILIEWLRIFAPSRERTTFTLSCRILIVVTVLFYGATIVALNLTCRPFQKIYDKTLPGTCIDIKKIHLGAVIVDLLLDIAILILPQRIIWGLKTSKTNRIGISTVFTIGILATIASAFLIKAVAKWNTSQDMTYHYSAVALWAIAEMTCGILVFSIPIVPKIYQGLNPVRWFGWVGPFRARLSGWVKRRGHVQSERQSRTRTRIARSRNYAMMNDSDRVGLHDDYGSPRPTDRQYGITVTTDIVVTEAVKPRPEEQPRRYLPWLDSASDVELGMVQNTHSEAKHAGGTEPQ
ncbi:hypothetical protein F5Y17DRAFT_452214 [Xylariaceae sp. FL0594]|nr:hypothetical protein F5Y17DRAFT_452214 [Xylariaceae sp. FL0594]